MIDLNKEREAFEAYLKSIDVDMYYIPNIIFDSAIYRFKDEFNADEDQEAALEEINTGWFAWIKCAEYKQAKFDELKAKLEAAQVPEGFVLVPKEFNEKLAEKMAAEMVNKPIPENDPVWIEIANKAYKDNLLMKKWEIIRNYKAMIEAAQGEGHE